VFWLFSAPFDVVYGQKKENMLEMDKEAKKEKCS
jgi:hypothetical protein